MIIYLISLLYIFVDLALSQSIIVQYVFLFDKNSYHKMKKINKKTMNNIRNLISI